MSGCNVNELGSEERAEAQRFASTEAMRSTTLGLRWNQFCDVTIAAGLPMMAALILFSMAMTAVEKGDEYYLGPYLALSWLFIGHALTVAVKRYYADERRKTDRLIAILAEKAGITPEEIEKL